MTRMCDFLDVVCSSDYFEACANKLCCKLEHLQNGRAVSLAFQRETDGGE